MKMKFYCLAIAAVLCLSVKAQNITNFSELNPNNATLITATAHGDTVRMTPSSPNNYHLVESHMFVMPSKAQGITAIRFGLHGADGGTATFSDVGHSYKANGGGGGTVWFTVNLSEGMTLNKDYPVSGNQTTYYPNKYGMPFFVTIGKNGESGSGYLVSSAGGGGGSTGMAWLVPGYYYENYIGESRMRNHGPNIAIAAGGGGGEMLNANVYAHGGGGGLTSSTQRLVQKGEVDCPPYSVQVAAGSSVLSDVQSDRGTTDPCLWTAVSESQNVTQSSATQLVCIVCDTNNHNAMLALTSLTIGQPGGTPCQWSGGPPVYNNQVQSLGCGGVNVTNHGFAGGAGFTGGGASSAAYTGWASWVGAGGGGAGTDDYGVGGYIDVGPFVQNIVPSYGGANWVQTYYTHNEAYINGGQVGTPASGWFEYYTIPDTIKPVIQYVHDTVYLDANGQVNLTGKDIPGISDNDSVQYIMLTPHHFDCNSTGTYPLRIVAVDFAGNTTVAWDTITVLNNRPPYINTGPLVYIPVKYVDIAYAPYTVSRGDFPVFHATCYDTSQLTYTWAPTTFSCAQNNSMQTVTVTVTEPNGVSTSIGVQFYVYTSYNPSSVYVDASATGNNDGTSWTDAYTDLQSALNFGCNGNRTFYVAQGTYYPDRGTGATLNDRNASFTLRDGDKIYGGFPSGGDVFDNRDPSTYLTYLSGEIGTAAKTDNSYHVVSIPGTSANTYLEGVRITGAYGSNIGGGVNIVSTDAQTKERAAFVNCAFTNNSSNNGAGVYFSDPLATGTISFTDCFFNGNQCGNLGTGAAIFVAGSGQLLTGITITNSAFSANHAGQGGAIYLGGTRGDIINCSFGYNYASAQGGALYLAPNCQLVNIYNTVIYGDTASVEIYQSPASNHIYYSDIQGSGGSSSWNSNLGIDGGHNIDANPQYVPGPSLNVFPASPLRNAGSVAYNTTTVDLGNMQRVMQDTIDIGAYETTPIVYVAWDAPNGGDGTSWATAFNQVQDALDVTYVSGQYKDVWVKGGTYYPYNNGSGRTRTIVVSRSQRLYGGFAGNETSLSQRNIPQHPTILSGDLGTQGNRSDNAYHIITLNQTINSRLDGFIFENGNADDTTNSNYQFGGAVYSTGYATAYPNTTFANCVFRKNNSNGGGGAIYCVASPSFTYSMTFRQCLFYKNTTDGNGGAVFINNTGGTGNNVQCSFYNCTGADNRASNDGGFAASRCTLLSVDTATINLYNTIVASDTGNFGEYVNERGIGLLHGYNSNTNFPNPHFVNAANPEGADGIIFTADDGLKLQPTSSSINGGNNAYLSTGIVTDSLYDVTGASRVQQQVVDMGAYEDFGCLGFTKLYVDSSIAVPGLGNSWGTAFKSFQDALKVLSLCPEVDTIFLATGTYYPGSTHTAVSRDTTFLINRKVTVLGGYPSGGGVRNVIANPVGLDGNVNGPTFIDNVCHVMCVVDATATDTVTLDGIGFNNAYAYLGGTYTIGGQAISRGVGGGLVIKGPTVVIRNCSFSNSRVGQGGGGIIDYAGKLIVSNSVFSGNLAAYGGAIRTEQGVSLVASGNTFFNNRSQSDGAVLSIYMNSTDVATLINNQFMRNLSVTNGGAGVLDGGTSNVYNNTFFNNTAFGNGGGFYFMPASSTSTVNLYNNIFYGDTAHGSGNDLYNSTANTTVTRSNNSFSDTYPDFYNAGNLLGADNLWGTSDDGLQLAKTSRMINQGKSSVVNYSTDITGANRVKLGTVDIGAFEADSVVTQWYVSLAQDSVTGDGLSWATAFPDFAQGVDASKSGDTVWVAEGTYTPTSGSYKLKSGVKIYGGFNATETLLSQRQRALGYNTILQGNGTNVMVFDSVNAAAVLDGFIIQNGSGAAGAGMQMQHSSPQVSNCVFTNNSASLAGGAISCVSGSPTFTNVIFYNNHVTGVNAEGGAVFFSFSYPVIRNCDFVSNTSNTYAGAVYSNSTAHPAVSNSAFSGNTAAYMYDDNFFAGGQNLSHNLLQTGNADSGNIVSTIAGFYSISNPAGYDSLWFTQDDGLQLDYSTSNLINRGSNDSVVNSAGAKDILGLSRIQNGTVDIGAYESPLYNYCDSAAFNSIHILYVDARNYNSGDGFSWGTAFATLGEALNKANYCSAFDTILVAAGTYYPTGEQADTNRKVSFDFIRSGYAVLGGYPHGGGPRNFGDNNTILSGNIGAVDTNADNSYHVLVFHNTDNTTTLDGFIISGGSANSINGDANGNGGGAWINGSNAGGLCKPRISNCVFTNNYAYYGGAVLNDAQIGGNASPTFINCVFTKNSSGGQGGAMYNLATYSGVVLPVITNCTFAENSADYNGGGIYSVCQPSGNVSATIKNTILWGNTSNDALGDQQFTGDGCTSTISYSIVQGGLSGSLVDGGHNKYVSPIFTDSVNVSGFNSQWMTHNDGLDIYGGSAAIDAGNPLGAPSTDITGTPRSGTPDIGAYENTCGGTVVKTLTMQSCDSVPSPNFRRWLTSSGVYNDTTVTRNGCDTIFTLNLTLGHTTTASFTVNACNTYTSPSGSFVWDSTGTYSERFPNSSGCDSVVTVNLTINHGATSAFSASSCDAYTYNGHTYTTSGVYTDTLSTTQGCDSVVTLTLSVETISNSATVNAAVCTAAETGASYQWINCSNQQPVNGATAQSFTATQNGNYACVVTKGNCTDTTNCVTVTGLNIEGLTSYNFSLYPNPNNGNFVIQHNYNGFVTAKLMNALGQQVREFGLTNSVTHIDINDLAAGVYQLQLNDKTETLAVIKVVKQ